jgi:hypothetical protein
MSMSKSHSRRAVLAGIATAPALAAPALALSSIEPDPSFAAIDRYKIAVDARTLAMRAENAAPGCPAAKTAHNEAMDREFSAFDELFTTTPTTIVGLAAMLDQLAARPYDRDDKDNAPNDPPIILMAFESGDHDEKVTGFLASAASMLRASSRRGV